MLAAVPAHTQPAPPPEVEADEEADWQALREAYDTYVEARNDENLEAVLKAARHYLDGSPEPGRRTETALGFALQVLERFERFEKVLELCDKWEPTLPEQDTFRIALRVYRGKAHAHLGNVEEATEAVHVLRNMRIDEDELARFVQHALFEIERILKLRPGSEPPAFELARLDNQEHTVPSEALFGDERYVLLLFWTSWCGKCRDLMTEELASLQRRSGDEAFELVSVGLNWRDSAEAQRKAVAEAEATWTHLYDSTSEVASDYGVRHVPFLLLVDPEGRTAHAGTAFRVLERIQDTLAKAFDDEANED